MLNNKFFVNTINHNKILNIILNDNLFFNDRKMFSRDFKMYSNKLKIIET